MANSANEWAESMTQALVPTCDVVVADIVVVLLLMYLQADPVADLTYLM